MPTLRKRKTQGRPNKNVPCIYTSAAVKTEETTFRNTFCPDNRQCFLTGKSVPSQRCREVDCDVLGTKFLSLVTIPPYSHYSHGYFDLPLIKGFRVKQNIHLRMFPSFQAYISIRFTHSTGGSHANITTFVSMQRVLLQELFRPTFCLKKIKQRQAASRLILISPPSYKSVSSRLFFVFLLNSV